MQLGFTPRMRIVHTSSQAIGQIYLPTVNTLLLDRLHRAGPWPSRNRAAWRQHSIAVTATMAITSILYFEVLRRKWKWSLVKAAPLVALFYSST